MVQLFYANIKDYPEVTQIPETGRITKATNYETGKTTYSISARKKDGKIMSVMGEDLEEVKAAFYEKITGPAL